MNNFNNGYTSYPNVDNLFGRTNQFEQQLQTNKWKVQNLQDALTRYAPPNSCGCYHCTIDNKEYEYEIYTDGNGQKSYKVYERIPCENNAQQNIDLEQILERLKKVEDVVNGKSATTITDGAK